MEADLHRRLHAGDLGAMRPLAWPEPEPPAIALRVLASPGAVAQLRGAIRGFADSLGLPGAIVDAAERAVGVAAPTIARHAFAGDAYGSMELNADCQEGTLEVVVSDDGDGLPADPTRADLAALALIGELTDDFSIGGGCTGGEVWMRFMVDREAFDARWP